MHVSLIIGIVSFLVLGGFAVWMIGESSDEERREVVKPKWVRLMRELAEGFRRTQLAMGRALLPAMTRTAKAMRRFALAYRSHP
jgi:hypothetical protein